MNPSEIIEKLRYNGKHPRRAILEAIAKQNEISPELLNLLQGFLQVCRGEASADSTLEYTLAFFLLAQFRERRAYPIIFEIFSIPGDVPINLTGDFVTESLGRVLASVAHGDTSLIEKLIENETLNEYVRIAALESLLTMFAENAISREKLVLYLKELFQHCIKRVPNYIWSEMVCCAVRLHPKELITEISKAYSDDLIDTFVIRMQEVEDELKNESSITIGKLRSSNSRKHYIVDTIKETEWWACFRRKKKSMRLNLITNLEQIEIVGRN